MFRSPSLPLHPSDDDHNNMSFNSPDPLADSLNDENALPIVRASSPLKPRAASSPTRRTATPPRKRIQNGDVGDSNVLLMSPSKTISEQILSPWKIRVTVEAEPENPVGDAMALGSGRRKTIKIPLRDVSSPLNEYAARETGRGRRGGDTVGQDMIKGKKRNATPVRGRNNSRSRSRRKSVTDLDIVVLGDDGDSDDWTKRKSPRKSPARGGPRRKKVATTAPVDHCGDDAVKNDGAIESPSHALSTKSPEEFMIREDTDNDEERGQPNEPEDSASPELRTIDLNRVSLRPRSVSVKHRKRQAVEEPLDVLRQSLRKVSNVSYPTPDSSVQDEQEEAGKMKSPDPQEQEELHDEGFDTILESEGFTMIDLSSIPSARNFMSSPLEVQDTQGDREDVGHPDVGNALPLAETAAPSLSFQYRPTAIPAYLTLQEGESDISSNVPSSPPVEIAPAHLPASYRSSPAARLITPPTYTINTANPPAPPQPTPGSNTQQAKPIHPGLAQARQAGRDLQTLISPKLPGTAPRTPSLLSPFRGPVTRSSRRSGDLFTGFDSGAKRELRAGLRLGEELAADSTEVAMGARAAGKVERYEQNGEASQTSAREKSNDVLISREVELIRADANMTRRTNAQEQDQEKEQDQQFPERDATPMAFEDDDDSVHSEGPRLASDETIQFYEEWAAERREISRQIQMMTPSKVIVIHDSDSDEDNGDLQRKEEHSNPSRRIEQSKAASGASPRIKIEPGLETQEDATLDVTQGEILRDADGITNGEGGDNDDIWLEEAEACNSSSSILENEILPDHHSRKGNNQAEPSLGVEVVSDTFKTSEQRRQRDSGSVLKVAKDLGRAGIGSKIPVASAMLTRSSSRGGSGERVAARNSAGLRKKTPEHSTFLTNGDLSGIMFASEQSQTWSGADGDSGRNAVRFGGRQIERVRRGVSSGSSNSSGTGTAAVAVDAEDVDVVPGLSNNNHTDVVTQDPDEGEDESMSVSHHSEDHDTSTRNDDNDDDESSIAPVVYSSSPPQQIKVPVKFNDSTMSLRSTRSSERLQRQWQQHQHSQSTAQLPPISPLSAPTTRPATPPRSALKGGRLSLASSAEGSHPIRDSSPNADMSFSLMPSSPSRRVEFAERNATRRETGSEASESMLSEDLGCGVYVEGLEMVVEDTGEEEEEEATEDEDEEKNNEDDDSVSVDEQPEADTKQQKSGWLEWLLGSKKDVAETKSAESAAAARVDHQREATKGLDGTQEEDAASRSAAAAINSKSSAQANTTTTTPGVTTTPTSSDTPSYLRPPSYPSDPSRLDYVTTLPTTQPPPLTTKGDFTNTHFRTLHIIHRKSSKPRFHAPSFEECRDGLIELVGQKWVVDETRSGMGVFEWVVGTREVQVVERFMKEVEYGVVMGADGVLEGQEWEAVKEKMNLVKWGWSERELMWRFCRIVVGEVVRVEEAQR